MDTSLDRSNQATSQPRRKVLIGVYSLAVGLYWMSLYLYVPTLPVYAKTKVESLAFIGTILSMYGLWQAIIRLPLGITTDWVGRRKPFILGGFALAGLGAYLMGIAENGNQLLIGRAITGLAAGTWVPLIVIFSGLFPPQEAIRATAILTLVNSVSRMIATSLTGWLNEIGGYPFAFFCAIGVAVLAMIVVLPIKEQASPPQKLTFRGIWQIIVRPDVLRPSLLGAVAQYVTWAATLSFTPILAAQLGASNVMLSFLTSVSILIISLGNSITALLSRRMNGRQLASISFVFLALGAILAAWAPSLPWLFLAQFMAGMGSGISHPLLMGMSIAKVDQTQRNIAMGLHQAIYGFGMFAGPWISGALAEKIGMQPMFAITGVAVLVIGLVGSKYLSK
jgi:MFS family permease